MRGKCVDGVVTCSSVEWTVKKVVFNSFRSSVEWAMKKVVFNSFRRSAAFTRSIT